MSTTNDKSSRSSSLTTTSDASDHTQHTSTWKRQARDKPMSPQHLFTTQPNERSGSTPSTVDIDIGTQSAAEVGHRQPSIVNISPALSASQHMRQHIAAKHVETQRAWLRRFSRLPMDGRLYQTPGHMTPDMAVELLKNDIYAPNHVALNMEFVQASPPTPAGGDLVFQRLLVARSDGLVCGFLVDNEGAPDALVNFLLDPNVTTVVHGFSVHCRISLSVWDSRLQAFKPKKDVKQLLKFGISNHLPPFEQFSIPADSTSAASFLFNFDMANFSGPPDHVLLLGTLFTFDCYAKLEQYSDDYVSFMESLGCQVVPTTNIWSQQTHNTLKTQVSSVGTQTDTKVFTTTSQQTMEQTNIPSTSTCFRPIEPARRPSLLGAPPAVALNPMPAQRQPQHVIPTRLASPQRLLVLPPNMELAFKDVIKEMKRAYASNLARRQENHWTAEHEAFRNHFRERARQMEPRPTGELIEIIDERIRQFINVRLGSKQ